MKSFLKKHSESFAKNAGLIAIGAAFAIGASVLAYTAPTGTAPSGNVAAPVNTSAFAQTKLGDLTIGNPGDLKTLKVNSAVIGVFASFNSLVGGRTGAFTDSIGGGGRYFSALAPNVNNNLFFQAGKVDGDDKIISGLTVYKVSSSDVNPLVQIKDTNGNFSIYPNSGIFSTFLNDKNALLARVEGNLTVDKELRLGTSAPANAVLAAKNTSGVAEWKTLETQDIGGNNDNTNLIYTKRYNGTDSAQAFCDGGDIAIGGGGNCAYGIKNSGPIAGDGSFLALSGTPINSKSSGWQVSCLRAIDAAKVFSGTGNGTEGTVDVSVICMKNTSLVTGFATANTTVPVTPPGPTGPNWHPAPAGLVGTSGQSCSSYMVKAGQNLSENITKIKGTYTNPSAVTGFGGETVCAVEYTSPVSWRIGPIGSNEYTGKCFLSSSYITANPSTATFKVVDSCSDANTIRLGNRETFSVKTELYY